MFTISAAQLLELVNLASLISTNAQTFAKVNSKTNRRDLLDSVQSLQELALFISSDAFQTLENLEKIRNKEEIKQAFAEAMAKEEESKAK